MNRVRYKGGYIAEFPFKLSKPSDYCLLIQELESAFERGRSAGKAEFKAEFKKLFSIH